VTNYITVVLCHFPTIVLWFLAKSYYVTVVQILWPTVILWYLAMGYYSIVVLWHFHILVMR